MDQNNVGTPPVAAGTESTPQPAPPSNSNELQQPSPTMLTNNSFERLHRDIAARLPVITDRFLVALKKIEDEFNWTP